MIDWYKKDGDIIHPEWNKWIPPEYEDFDDLKLWIDDCAKTYILIFDGESIQLYKEIPGNGDFRVRSYWYKRNGQVLFPRMEGAVPSIWKDWRNIRVLNMHGYIILQISNDWREVHGDSCSVFADDENI